MIEHLVTLYFLINLVIAYICYCESTRFSSTYVTLLTFTCVFLGVILYLLCTTSLILSYTYYKALGREEKWINLKNKLENGS